MDVGDNGSDLGYKGEVNMEPITSDTTEDPDGFRNFLRVYT